MDATLPAAVTNLLPIVAITGAVGTGAFGLVDALKILPYGGISNFGFKFIRQAVHKLAPVDACADATCLSEASLVAMLHSHWINGVDTASQIDNAKALILLRLSPSTAACAASWTDVDPELLTQAATCAKEGTAMTPEQTAILARYSQAIESLLNQAYQRADQRYRNASKCLAIPMAVGLALLLCQVLPMPVSHLQAILLGVLATPLAPMAKDIASILADGFKPAAS